MELYCVSLPGNPTVTKLSINVGGANDADVALFAKLAVPINDPLNDPVLICNELLTVPVGRNCITCADEETMFAGIFDRPVYDICDDADTNPGIFGPSGPVAPWIPVGPVVPWGPVGPVVP
jgi:hypothetical protein